MCWSFRAVKPASQLLYSVSVLLTTQWNWTNNWFQTGKCEHFPKLLHYSDKQVLNASNSEGYGQFVLPFHIHRIYRNTAVQHNHSMIHVNRYALSSSQTFPCMFTGFILEAHNINTNKYVYVSYLNK